MMKRLILSAAIYVALCLYCTGGARAQTEDAPKIELGVQFSSLTINEPDFGGTRTEPGGAGGGGRFTYNLTHHVALEAEGNFFPINDRSFSSTLGGNTSQALFGVKAGRRFEKFGVFGKARPGFVSFSNTLKEINFTATGSPGDEFYIPDFRFGRKTYFAADLGGVLEFYPSRRLMTRFDFGDTIIRYGERPGAIFYGSPGIPPTVFEQPAETKHNFQFSAGIGFRF